MLAIGLKQGGAKRGCHVPEATLTPLNLSRIEVHARGILRPRRCRCASCRPLRWCFRSGAFAHGVERCRVPPGTTNVCNFFSHECAHPCICARRARALAVALSKSHYALAGVAAWRVERAVLVPAAHPPVCSLLPLSLVDAELYMVGGPCCGTLFFREQLDSEALHRPRAPPRLRPWRPGPAPARAGQEYSHQVSGRSGALRPSLRARLRFRGGSGWVTRAGCVA